MRRGWFVLILSGLLACLPAVSPAPSAARADAAPVSRADHLAALLRRDPVYVTDHAPRLLPADAAARIKAAVGRLGVPVHVAVTPTLLVGGQGAAELIPLLRDRLARDGVYLVMDPKGGDSEARQYGGGRSLPVKDALTAADLELPSDAGAVATIERFVDITLSGHARERRDSPGPRPRSKVRIALDEDDASEVRAQRTENAAFAGGTALGLVPVLGLLIWGRRRRRRAGRTARQGRR